MRSALHPELLQAARELLQRSSRPLSLSQMCKQLTGPFRVPEKRKGELLALLADSASGVFQWPKFRGSVRFWHREPQMVAESAAIEIARNPTSESNLLKELPKKAFGYPAKLGKKVIGNLIGDGRLFKDPPWGAKHKLTLIKPDPERYRKQLEAELATILNKYAALGISPRSLVDQICKQDEVRGAPAQNQPRSVEQVADTIMTALEKVEPRKGLVVAVAKVRQAPGLQFLAKSEFDRAIMYLRAKQRVFLHDHDAPYTLSEKEREQLVTDGKDGFYVGIAWREPGPISGVDS